MKTMITSLFLTAFALTANTAFAEGSKCPQGSNELMVCTPKTEDGIVDFASVSVCKKNKSYALAIDDDGKIQMAKAKQTIQMGGTSYSLTASGITVILDVATAFTPDPSHTQNATVTMLSKGDKPGSQYKMSSPYSCTDSQPVK